MFSPDIISALTPKLAYGLVTSITPELAKLEIRTNIYKVFLRSNP